MQNISDFPSFLRNTLSLRFTLKIKGEKGGNDRTQTTCKLMLLVFFLPCSGFTLKLHSFQTQLPGKRRTFYWTRCDPEGFDVDKEVFFLRQ